MVVGFLGAIIENHRSERQSIHVRTTNRFYQCVRWPGHPCPHDDIVHGFCCTLKPPNPNPRLKKKTAVQARKPCTRRPCTSKPRAKTVLAMLLKHVLPCTMQRQLLLVHEQGPCLVDSSCVFVWVGRRPSPASSFYLVGLSPGSVRSFAILPCLSCLGLRPRPLLIPSGAGVRGSAVPIG